jgi:hypothetical protein
MTALDETLPEALAQQAGADQLVDLLENRARIPIARIATICGMTPATIRHWALGNRRPTEEGFRRLRYLAEVVGVLAGSLTVVGINQWLTAPNTRLPNQYTPTSAMARGDSVRVLDAAQWLVGDGVA